jgi:hypothetical protein
MKSPNKNYRTRVERNSGVGTIWTISSIIKINMLKISILSVTTTLINRKLKGDPLGFKDESGKPEQKKRDVFLLICQ